MGTLIFLIPTISVKSMELTEGSKFRITISTVPKKDRPSVLSVYTGSEVANDVTVSHPDPT